MGSRARHRALLTLLGVLTAVITPAALAQPACSNDVPVVFSTDPGGSVNLNDATVREITGSNDDDRDIALSLGGPLEATAQGSILVVDGIDISDFPASAVTTGFRRNLGRFWEVNYANGDYVFEKRGDLQVDVTFTVVSPLAPLSGSGSTSTATVRMTQRNMNVTWHRGSNSLRRLRGGVRVHYEDLATLAHAGEHRATINVCVEVSGNL
jgi:hypothetical protein